MPIEWICITVYLWLTLDHKEYILQTEGTGFEKMTKGLSFLYQKSFDLFVFITSSDEGFNKTGDICWL